MEQVRFENTAVPSFTGKEDYVKTAGMIVIGDEVLNGKTKDTNSNFMARTLFDLGVDLCRIEVIKDDEQEIVEAATRFVDKYDLVVTSGGIGPTHDDITYSSLATAFTDGKLAYDDETVRRMEEMSKHRADLAKASDEQRKARMRMALFPDGPATEVIRVKEDFWVPVVRLKGKLIVLPGVPSMFQQLFEAYVTHYVPLPPSTEKPHRFLIHTKMPESAIAPYLDEVVKRGKPLGVRVGSYPKMHNGVDVSLIGKDETVLEQIAQDVAKQLDGEVKARGKLGEV